MEGGDTLHGRGVAELAGAEQADECKRVVLPQHGSSRLRVYRRENSLEHERSDGGWNWSQTDICGNGEFSALRQTAVHGFFLRHDVELFEVELIDLQHRAAALLKNASSLVYLEGILLSLLY